MGYLIGQIHCPFWLGAFVGSESCAAAETTAPNPKAFNGSRICTKWRPCQAGGGDLDLDRGWKTDIPAPKKG